MKVCVVYLDTDASHSSLTRVSLLWVRWMNWMNRLTEHLLWGGSITLGNKRGIFHSYNKNWAPFIPLHWERDFISQDNWWPGSATPLPFDPEPSLESETLSSLRLSSQWWGFRTCVSLLKLSRATLITMFRENVICPQPGSKGWGRCPLRATQWWRYVWYELPELLPDTQAWIQLNLY